MFGAELPQSIYPLVPDYGPVRLRKKTAAGSPDTFAAAVTVNARVRSASVQEVINSRLQMTEPAYMISVYDVGESTFVHPEAEDEIIGGDGTLYRVRHVEVKVLGTLHKCLCVKKRRQS